MNCHVVIVPTDQPLPSRCDPFTLRSRLAEVVCLSASLSPLPPSLPPLSTAFHTPHLPHPFTPLHPLSNTSACSVLAFGILLFLHIFSASSPCLLLDHG
eukprot:m.285929 g.285929  ORF g.285929 m.285929 type:complete len:99 (+) comp157762_c0_seq1:59-355(+)